MPETQQIVVLEKVLEELRQARTDTNKWREEMVSYVASNNRDMIRVSEDVRDLKKDMWGTGDENPGVKAKVAKIGYILAAVWTIGCGVVGLGIKVLVEYFKK